MEKQVKLNTLGFWVDSNNNQWDARKYDEKAATEASKSLVNCKKM